MTEKAIVPVTKETWEVIKEIAPVAVASRLFGVTEEQAMVVMLTGHELGLPLTAAFDVIYVSKNGRRTLRPKGALALVHNSGLLEEFSWESDDQKATITMKRKGGQRHSMTLTIEQAKRAGWKSTAWETTPANLLRWRPIGWMCDLLFSDVLCGLGIADDSYLPVEITEDGDVVEASGNWIVKPVTDSPPQTPPKENGGDGREEPSQASDAPIEAKQPEPVEETPASEETAQPETAPEPEDATTIMNQLVQEFGAPAIMAANEGQIPNSLDAWKAVRTKLQEQASD